MPSRSRSREEELVYTTRRLITGTIDDGGKDDDELPRMVADYVQTPKRSRCTRRVQITEESDEDKRSSSRKGRMKAACLDILLSRKDTREPRSPRGYKSRREVRWGGHTP